MSPVELVQNWSEDAVAGIAEGIRSGIDPAGLAARYASDPALRTVLEYFLTGFQAIFRPLVALMGALILIIASNAGLLGISRISFSLAEHRSLPPIFGRIHPRFKTPYFSIIVFAAVSAAILAQGLLLPNLFTELGALYAFGSMLSFSLAHASILALRVKRPDIPRPFKLRWNWIVKGRGIPITAMVGLVATAGVWIVVLVMQPYSRWFGIAWMAVGLALYVAFRKSKGLSLAHERKEASEPPGPSSEVPSPGVRGLERRGGNGV
jgi:APA family basic amino acid/polyamine antiporter